MALENWIAISAIATFILAVAAFWAIWQNRGIQKRNRRERLLNEIIEWAVSISKWRIDNKSMFREMAGKRGAKQKQMFLLAYIAEAEQSFRGMQGKNLYINNVVQTFDQNLQKAAAKLVSDMNEYINFLESWCASVGDSIKAKLLIDKQKQKDSFKKADKHMESLEKSANKVIEEAARIKTTDIR